MLTCPFRHDIIWPSRQFKEEAFVLKIATSVLKNNLSYYLHEIQKGNKFIVTDRGRPIAKVIPFEEEQVNKSVEETIQLLSENQAISLPTKKLFSNNFSKITLSKTNVSDIVIKMRDEE